ncbi:MAG: recombinase family protein, partial [Ruminococcus sp.]|nr:recombinase family protein [Ruminococcus sp.]
VKRILGNPIYIGRLEQLRYTTVSYKNHKIIQKDKDDWAVIENNHEPIISQELWYKVREIEDSVSTGKQTKKGVTMPLSGLGYYADCGTKMKQHYSSGAKAPYGYVCGFHARFGKEHCTSHHINYTDLESIILQDIRRQIDFVMNDDKAREKYFARKRGERSARDNSDRKGQKDIEKRITDLDKLIQKIYEDKVLGSLPEKTCADLLIKYQQEKDTLQTELDTLVQRAEADCQDEADVDEYIRRSKSYAGAEELTRQMCLELIDAVTVDEFERGKQERDIHIYYKFIDKGYTGKSDD